MQCPRCESSYVVKNGWRKEKQNYLCRNCRRQFIATHEPKGYSSQVKKHCLTLYCNGMGFRAIERSTGVCNNTVINWVKQAFQKIPEENYEIPQTAQLDERWRGESFFPPLSHELQTFVGSRKTLIWLWTVVNSHQAGILKWIVGDLRSKTFRRLWWIIRGRCCFLYITDGYSVYPCFIDDCDHLISKTAMTRVEGENSRLRHPDRSFTSSNVLLFQVC